MSQIVKHPAPYPEVNALLQELLESVQTILGSHFVGAYLFGSLTSGDFDQHSDIDVVVATDDELPDDLFLALKAMHARIAAFDSWWATQLEVSYIPRRALRRHDPAGAVHPHIDRGKGESLRMMWHDSDWVIQRYTLRERGITLTGPPPQTLIDPISANDLRRAMLAILRWPAEILDDPTQIKKRGYQSYIVLTMCRMLYTLQYGTVASKPVAAHWAQEKLDQRWRALIERAVVGRQHPQSKASSEDLSGTMDFIRYTLERSRQFEIPANEV
jgi:predicted nucleotidyltransferase